MLAALDARARASGPPAHAAAGARVELGEALVARPGRAGRAADAAVQLAGSARRLAESVKDIDLVAITTDAPTALAKSLAKLAADRERQLGRQGRRQGAHAHRRRAST